MSFVISETMILKKVKSGINITLNYYSITNTLHHSFNVVNDSM